MYRWSRSNIIFVLIMGTSSVILACGPFFPSSYLASSDNTLLAAPGFRFYDEIDRIPFDQSSEFRAVYPPKEQGRDPRQHMIQVDCKELQEALDTQPNFIQNKEKLLEEYRKVRIFIEQSSVGANKGTLLSMDQKLDSMESDSIGEFLKQLPEEFRLYLEGVIYYRISQQYKAIQVWEKLLTLPAYQRHFRSTWAAYMLGNCCSDNLDKSRNWYQKVRQFAWEGYRDALGLAAASYGQEAARYLQEGDYNKAIELYMIQKQTGDRSAVPSLKWVCSGIFKKCSQETLVSLVQTPLTRQTLIAFTLAYGGSGLLEAIEEANLHTLENADRLAMIAYAAGDFERAQRWLTAADPDSLISRRVRAKLYLRSGRLQEAAADLAFIARHLEPSETLTVYGEDHNLDNTYRINSELGTVYISQKLYVQAADALIRGGNWTEGSYILERVLTPEELQAYVDANWPASNPAETVKDNDYQQKHRLEVRHLLARRFTRLGRLETAKSYYPADFQEVFTQYAAGLKTGFDLTRSARDRADALWTAAWLMRHKGMELVGYELLPDCAINGGSFVYSFDLGERKEGTKKNTLNVVDAEEIDRATREPAVPDKRYHYRYVASELARQAVELMPDQDDETARRLCLAGTWHRDRDKDYADVFYKSLVRRCGTTALGKEADKIRWFPKIPDTLDAAESHEAPGETVMEL